MLTNSSRKPRSKLSKLKRKTTIKSWVVKEMPLIKKLPKPTESLLLSGILIKIKITRKKLIKSSEISMKLIKFSAIPKRKECLIKVLILMIKNLVVCMLISTPTISLKCSSEVAEVAAASILEVLVVSLVVSANKVVVVEDKVSLSDLVEHIIY